MSEASPRVSVVICALDMELLLGQQLEAVLKQAAPFAFEVVVVDNGSTDQTNRVARDFAERDPRVRVIHASPRGLNIARNAGVSAASGELIAMCDADDEVEPGWLGGLVAAWQPGTFVGGSLRVASPNSARVQRKWGALGSDPQVRSPKNGVQSPSGANCLFTRQMWQQVGEFNEQYSGAGDETEFFARAGGKGFTMVSAPNAIVGYRLPETASKALIRGYRYGLHGSKVRANLGSDPDPLLVAKQFAWLVVNLPAAVLGEGGLYTWLEMLGKRAGETRYLVRHP